MRGLRRIVAGLAALAVGCTDGATPEVVVETTITVRVERTIGFDGEIVTFALLADLTGPGAEIDRERVSGIETYWAAVNAEGGFDGRFAVELIVLDHGGDPTRAAVQLAEMVDDVMAIAFVSESVVDSLAEPLSAAGLLAIPAVSTADLESQPLMLVHSLPVEAALVSVFDALSDASWCVVADQSPLGGRIAAAAAPAAAATSIAPPAVYDVASAELATSITDAGCSHIYIEVGPATAPAALVAVPTGRTVVRRSVLGHGLPTAEGVEVNIIDDGSEWRVDATPGMSELVAAMSAHTPDADPDPRLRAGFASQIQLDAIVGHALASGDVRRGRLAEVVTEIGLIDMRGLAGDVDRSIVPGELPRQLRLFVPDPDGDDLGWAFVGSHRAPQVDAVLAGLVPAG